MSVSKIIVKKETTINEDAEGNQSINTKEISYQTSQEPDYIKIYTKTWCEFNQIPIVYRDLFMELVTRMTYCNASDLDNSQLVNTGKPWSDSICNKLNWKKAMYQRGLKALCECNAIKKVGKGVYQINPNYAGRGSWRYNPKLKQGGVKELVATFDFPNKTVNTKIVWADDGTDNQLNDLYRQGLNVTSKDNTVLTATKVNANSDDNVPF